jgi:hypothetical protein
MTFERKLLPKTAKVKDNYILKIDKAPNAVRSRIIREIGLGKTFSEIVRILDAEYQYKTTVATLSMWAKRRTNMMREYMFGSPEFNNKLQEEYMAILFEFKKLNEKTWTMIEELEKVGDIPNRLEAFKEIRAQIEMANKILGMVPESVKLMDKAQDYQGLGNRIAERLDKLANEGVLEVKEEIIKKKMSLKDKDNIVDNDVIDIISVEK